MTITHVDPQALLYVLSHPKESETEFHDWYNNEHGPARLCLPYFSNGYRYKANDGQTPEWLATYDIEDVNKLEEESYKQLRESRSERETRVIEQEIEILDRRMYTLVSSRGTAVPEPGSILVAVAIDVENEHEEDFDRWYEEEHIDLLSQVPGWQRTRRFKLFSATGEGTPALKHLALHDYRAHNGLDGPEHARATSTPWRTRVMNTVRASYRRTYALSYIFSPGARDLSTSPVIDSIVPSHDGTSLHYLLEGNPDPDAPTLVFSNSLMTDLRMWDALVDLIKAQFPQYRLLRYDTRGHGRSMLLPDVPADFDALADDIAALLRSIRVSKAHAVIGVSMGGVTVLNFALRHPDRLNCFVAADCNVASSPANSKAWAERVQLAEERGMSALADSTVQRWFTPSSVSTSPPALDDVRRQISETPLAGFKSGAGALSDYGLRGRLGELQVPGLFVVGAEDGALPAAMGEYVASVPTSVGLVQIPETGHLPMVEKPAVFLDAIRPFLVAQT
ncbi:alpha/beta-hydrolase [Punctularia strigosozonata HHB-11173 SS5]|uniref:Alpha/beta-hydrolase n=1 Tax=Punctularia strigosozonata (strain HHB-11173) TaxID=741275 RepID=R7S5D8_PUNST|nr:alpha/beta-hydrolase [Punctularia strigosozonata HHB-11173 SS5]EIN05189.1 alpha/beta-hydrolase [Punctularia strigosozonata HHB-11173 SS5]